MSSSGKVYFIGFGPGDPELLTLKGRKILEKADLIIYPGSLIEERCLSDFKGEKVNSYGKNLEEIVELIVSAVRAGKTVARVQSGDPSIFGAIGEQIRELERRNVGCEVIPGVSSVSASSASLKIELTTPEIEGIAIVRPAGRTLKRDHLEELAKLPLTIVVLLGTERIEYVASKVSNVRGKDEPCAIVYHASREDESVLISTLGRVTGDVRNTGIKRTATIIIGKAVRGYEERSHLYGAEKVR